MSPATPLPAGDTPPPAAIAVSGASGLLGTALQQRLGDSGPRLIRLVRDTHGFTAGPQRAPLESLAGIDAVIHLAGYPIAQRRWSAAVKQEIRDSRVVRTGQLCEQLAALPTPPQTLLCASAIGIYGDRGEELLPESAAPGEGFLADVGQQWEAACGPAAAAGIRVVHLRFGIILSTAGGALPPMLRPARWSLGGPLGSGRQWWSWISLDDAVAAILHALATPALQGPVNLVAPHPLRQADFAKTLGAVLRRPAVLPAPAIALRLALGEMAQPLLLASAHVLPEALVQSGFRFRHPYLRPCLEQLLG